MDQIRYDIRDIERLLRTQAEERASIQEQLKLTDYEAIKDRLDACILWLNSYPEQLEKCLDERSMLNAGAQQNQDKQKENAGKIEELEKGFLIIQPALRKRGSFSMQRFHRSFRRMHVISVSIFQ